MVDYSNIPRDSRRVPLATKVQFKFDRFSGFLSEYSANISPTGMYIVSSNPEPPGRVLDLEFRLGDGFEIIQGKGEVVWSRSVADGPNRPPGMGIRFVELSEGSKDLIYRIVDRYVQEGGTPFDLTTARDRHDLNDAPSAPAAAAPPPPAAPAAAPFSDLPPLDLEQHPFPDLDLDPVKDSSGQALPWFSAEPGGAPSGSAPSGPAVREEEPVELFPSIGPALEEVDEAEEMPVLPAAPPAPVRMPLPEPPPAPAPLLFPSAAPAPVRPERPVPPPLSFAPEPLAPAPAAPAVSAASPVPVDLFASFDPGLPMGTEPPSSVEPATLSDPGLFADYLPKTAARSETPPRRPLASVAGGAAAQEEKRRVSPLLLVVGVLAVLAAAGFFLRDRITGLLGLGGDDEKVAAAPAPPRHPRRKPGSAAPPVAQDGLTSGLTSDMSPVPATSVAADPAPSPTPAKPPAAEKSPPPAPPAPAPRPQPAVASAPSTPPGPPEVVQRKRPPAPAPVAPPAAPSPAPAPAAGPALTAVDRITFEESMGGTDIVLWGNGAIRPESYTKSQMGDPPRVLIVVNGIQKPFPQPRIAVGTGEVKSIRIGYHDAPKGHALHVVIDLAGAKVKVSRVDHDGQRLRIHLQKG